MTHTTYDAIKLITLTNYTQTTRQVQKITNPSLAWPCLYPRRYNWFLTIRIQFAPIQFETKSRDNSTNNSTKPLPTVSCICRSKDLRKSTVIAPELIRKLPSPDRMEFVGS